MPSNHQMIAQYLIETPFPVERVAKIIAGEQSTGSFISVAGKQDVERYKGQVLSVEELGTVSKASLASGYFRGGREFKPFATARVKISFPYENVGANLATWWTTLAGNLFELGELSGIRLEQIDPPEQLLSEAPGPQFGVSGTRNKTGVNEGPVVGTIIKPSIGFSPTQYGERVRQLCGAGVDFIKDDELMANPPHCPINERIAEVMKVINDHAQRSGRKVMYAFNISDRYDRMRRHHDTVVANGGTCVMVVLNTIGLCGLEALRAGCELPIHGHRSGWGMMTRHPRLGTDFQPYQLLNRLAGADQIHISGIGGKFWDEDDVVASAGRDCLETLSPSASGQPVMPVMSAGQWGGQAPKIFEKLGSTELIYLAGGGIQGHPDGLAAGVEAIREAWRAAVRGVSLTDAAESCPPLATSLNYFGSRSLS